MSGSWATGGPRSKVRAPVADPLVDGPVPDHPPAPQADREGRGERGGDRSLAALAEQASAIAAEWAPTAARIVLGLVFFWFGYHELVQPGGWTQYVPVVSESSSPAIILVLAHGAVLFVLGSALVFGVAPRVAAAVATVLMLEIVISLAVTGLDATAVRDVGVLGFAICLTGGMNQHLVIRD